MALRSRETLSEFWASGVSKVGVAFFIALLIISFYVLATYPLDFGVRFWNKPQYWADNPRAAAPSWTQSFTDIKKAEHLIFETSKADTRYEGNVKNIIFRFKIHYDYDEFPQFTSFSISNVIFHDDPPVVYLSLERPDGKEIKNLLELALPWPTANDTAPYVRYADTPYRIYLSKKDEVLHALASFLRREFELNQTLTPREIGKIGPEKFMFGVPDESGDFNKILKGDYTLTVRVETYHPDDTVERVKFVVAGTLFGAMGTDILGRDLAVGLLFGFPIALFIGFVTSTLTTLMGSAAGVISGYKGGKVDTFIQRAADILNNIPLLPILIFLVFVLGQSIWNIVLVLIVFGWGGLTIMVRSMVLQVKSSQFIEASVSVGAKPRWIMFKHIFPQVAPYVFTQLIFFTPSAILAEAGLSFLGLGDPSIPTWGQILERGYTDGAIYLGYWWWVVPPGLLIVLTAVCFIFIALGLEPVVNPKLRRMK